MNAVAAGHRQFACSLYHELAQGDGNLVFSPFSVSSAMAMAYAGARGRTAEELAEVLHFDLPSERLHAALGRLRLRLEGRARPGERAPRLRIANGLWGQRGVGCLESFRRTLEAHYGAPLRELDLVGDPAGSRRAINRAIEEATEGRITGLVPDGAIEGAPLVVTDAAYFRAYWHHQFRESLTHYQPFYRLNGDSVAVQMMHQTRAFPYVRGEGYQALSLPYYGREQAMVVVLPDTGSFAAVEAAVGSGHIGAMIEGLEDRNANVGLPKFRFSRGADLVPAFRALGAPHAFAGGADFSGVSGQLGLYIGAVRHMATIAVNERWTEAAAGTVVEWMREMGPGKPVDFVADRPFLFLIVDKPTGAILFMGRVMDPTA